jgi:hypothetical protein
LFEALLQTCVLTGIYDSGVVVLLAREHVGKFSIAFGKSVFFGIHKVDVALSVLVFEVKITTIL